MPGAISGLDGLAGEAMGLGRVVADPCRRAVSGAAAGVGVLAEPVGCGGLFGVGGLARGAVQWCVFGVAARCRAVPVVAGRRCGGLDAVSALSRLAEPVGRRGLFGAAGTARDAVGRCVLAAAGCLGRLAVRLGWVAADSGPCLTVPGGACRLGELGTADGGLAGESVRA
ncbi:hypothetical protein [Actinomadura sp. WAC 06369]|uniref:hypothetical protein n=1 Tax=Actinomadura sp. WAC 06369 TaxID=2203193 RepID=UPI000F7BA022|nr:hypothetical protein [Actinomadura sp. WAC 06369]